MSDDRDVAMRLARLVEAMRPGSRYALEKFLEAAEQGYPGASLTLHGPTHDDRLPEATLEIDPRKSP